MMLARDSYTVERVAPPEPKFRLVSFADIKVNTTTPYLVKGLIPQAGLTVVWGPPKCGKSFWATDLGLHIALGWEYRGRRVKGGPVVYCAMEGAAGYGARMEAFRLHNPSSDQIEVPFYLIASPMKLVCDHAELIAAIRYALSDLPPVAVFLDTLNRSIGGSESDDRDMSAYVAAADAVRDAFACSVNIIHHCGVDGTRPRGHTSLTGAADAQLAVKRDAAGNIVVTVEAMKDGPEGDTIVSRLDQVEVGTDEDDDPITSCVVVPVDGEPIKQTRWTQSLSVYRDALSAALGSFGVECRPFPDGPQVRAVDREYVRAEFKRTYPADGDTEAKKADALKKAFKRAETSAREKGLTCSREVGGVMMVWTV